METPANVQKTPVRSSLTRFLIMFLAVVMVIVLLMYTTVYQVEQKYLKQWLLQVSLGTIENIKNQFDDVVFASEVDDLTKKVLQDVLDKPQLGAFFSGEAGIYDYETDIYVQQYIRSRAVAFQSRSGELIEDIGIYSKQRNRIISLYNNFNPSEERRRAIFGSENIDTSYGEPFFWQTLTDNRPMTFSVTPDGATGIYVNFIRKVSIPSIPGTQGGAVIITMNEYGLDEEFNSIIRSNMNDTVPDETQFMLIDGQGNIISAQDKSLLNQNISIFGIEMNDEMPNHIFGELDGKQVLFTFGSSSRTSFYYFSSTPMSSVTAVSDVISRLLLFITILSLGIGVVISFFLAKYSARPLQNLKKACLLLLAEGLPNAKSMPDANEYAVIQSTLDRLDDRLRYHEKVFIRAKPIINQYILNMLISGHFSPEQVMQSFQMIGYELTRPRFVMLAAQLVYRKTIAKEQVDREERCTELLTVIGQTFWCSNAEMAFGKSEDGIIFIINCDNEAQNVTEIIMQLMDYVAQFPLLSIRVGVSAPFQEISSAPEACRSLHAALRYAFLYPEEPVFFCEETARWDNADLSELYELSGLVKTAIVSGQEDKYNQLLDDLLRRAKINRCPLKGTLLTLCHIRQALEKTAQNADITIGASSSDDVFPEGVDCLLDYVEYLRVTGTHLFAMLRHRSESRNLELVARTEEYVRSRIMDSNLSLSTVAGALGVSAEHLSRMFKRTAGINFADFLIGEKLLYARTLLLMTDDKIQDIAIKCGYSNPQYFIGKFKKAYGTTPNEYRQYHLRTEGEKLPAGPERRIKGNEK